MINITFEFSSFFSRYLEGKTRLQIEIEPGFDTLHILSDLGIPQSEIGLVTNFEEKVSHDYIPKDGDILRVYPTIIGG